MRRFRKDHEERTIAEIGGLAEQIEAFVKLKRAKLVVVRWKSERPDSSHGNGAGDDYSALSGVASSVLDI